MVTTIDRKRAPNGVRDGLKFLIERIIENRPVHVADQVDKATLVQTLESIVGRIEIGDQNTLEILEHLP